MLLPVPFAMQSPGVPGATVDCAPVAGWPPIVNPTVCGAGAFPPN